MKNTKEIIFTPPSTQEKKITLNLQQIVTPPPAPKPMPVVTPSVVPQPVIKKKTEPKPKVQAVKKILLDKSKKIFAQKSTEENNATKIKPEPKKKIVKKVVKKKPVKRVVIKKVPAKQRVAQKPVKYRQPQRTKDPLANMLMGSGTSMTPKKSRSSSNAGSYGERMIKRLYGSEFNTFSTTQQKFIRNNLGNIHRITQNTLTRNGYPDVAVRTRQQGTNVVSFYLHPDGDISGLRLKTPIGYQALDQNTLDVIRIAYKDYPLPNQKTKIVFYVMYSLY